MSVSKQQPMGSKDEIAQSLRGRASELWGHKRAAEIEALIEQTAGRVWRLSQDLPPAEEEPGFYF